LSGAATAVQATARNALAISGPLGSTIATRSLEWMPMPRSAWIVLSTCSRSAA
jgi:hypothetical protein